MKPTREETLHNEAPRLLPDHALCEGGVYLQGAGSVSKVEMVTPTALIYKVLFPSISTFETPQDSRVVIGQVWCNMLFLQVSPGGRDRCGIFGKSRLISNT